MTTTFDILIKTQKRGWMYLCFVNAASSRNALKVARSAHSSIVKGSKIKAVAHTKD